MTRKQTLILVLTAGLYLLLALSVNLRLWTNFDLGTIETLSHLIPRQLDLFLSLFSLIGSAEATGLVIVAYLWLACPPGSRLGLVLLFALVAVIELIGKSTIYQPGPPHVYYRYAISFGFPTGGLYTPYSFPSGHSARSVFVGIVCAVWILQTGLSAGWKRSLIGILAAGEVIMLISRVSLGEHWSTDVIGGALLASALILPWLYANRSLLPARQADQPSARRLAADPSPRRAADRRSAD